MLINLGERLARFSVLLINAADYGRRLGKDRVTCRRPFRNGKRSSPHPLKRGTDVLSLVAEASATARGAAAGITASHFIIKECDPLIALGR
jgi:hypothetical protein